MRVLIPSALHSYTDRKAELEATGATIAELIRDLDRRHPGLRFRIVDEQDALRPHIRISVNSEVVSDLNMALRPDDQVAIIMAFSGG